MKKIILKVFQILTFFACTIGIAVSENVIYEWNETSCSDGYTLGCSFSTSGFWEFEVPNPGDTFIPNSALADFEFHLGTSSFFLSDLKSPAFDNFGMKVTEPISSSKIDYYCLQGQCNDSDDRITLTYVNGLDSELRSSDEQQVFTPVPLSGPNQPGERFFVNGSFKRTEIITQLLFNGTPTTPETLPPIGSGDILQAEGVLDVAVNLFTNGSILTTKDLRFGNQLLVDGGLVQAKVGDKIRFKKESEAIGHGQIEGKVRGALGSSIEIKNGDLIVGDSTQTSAVNLDSNIIINQNRKLELKSADKSVLGGQTELSGGSIDSLQQIELKSTAGLMGHGRVEGKIKGFAGSAIQVEGGDLSLGDSSKAEAVKLDSAIKVAQDRKLELKSADKSILGGQTELSGGSVGSLQQIELASTAGLMGHGRVEGKIKGFAGSAIQVEGGDLSLGDSSKAEAVKLDSAIKVAQDRKLELKSADKVILGGGTELKGGILKTENGLENKIGGELKGSGQFQGHVFNQGKITPGNSIGIQYFNDGLTLTDTSEIELEIGGTNNSNLFDPEYDQLFIGGDFILDGLLEVNFLGTYEAQIGDIFDIFIADTIENMFSILDMPVLNDNYFLDSYVVNIAGDKQAFRLEIASAYVSTPATILLICLGLLVLIISNRGHPVRHAKLATNRL